MDIPGCSFTLFSHDSLAPPLMTGYALDEAAAAGLVEALMTLDDRAFRGVVRCLGARTARVCARAAAEAPGAFVWRPGLVWPTGLESTYADMAGKGPSSPVEGS